MNILGSPGLGEKGSDNISIPSRRRFLQLAGGIAGAGLVLSACHQRTGPTDIYVGSGDTALLNFLYVLEQMEADFFTKAVTGAYIGISQLEYLALVDMRDQEIAHREYLQGLLGKDAITAIVTNFSGVNFADRTSVLTNASVMEDIVSAGYNAAAGRFQDQSFPQSFCKIASVEGRHASYFRDALSHNNFADSTVVDVNGLSQAPAPSVVLTTAQQFLTTRFDSSNLPN